MAAVITSSLAGLRRKSRAEGINPMPWKNDNDAGDEALESELICQGKTLVLLSWHPILGAGPRLTGSI
jgi:hypothetical protein